MALRRFLALLRFGARARGAMAATAAPGEKARACASARVRAIGARVDECSASALACAEARAKAARAYLLPARLRAEAAGAVAARHLRHGRDQAVSRFMRLAYGQSPPPRTDWLSRVEAQIDLLERIFNLLSRLDNMRQLIELLTPFNTAIILGAILAPIYWFYSNMVVPAAPESICPFLGLRAIEFDECPVREGLEAVFYLSAKCGGLVVLFLGGLCLCVATDLGILAVSWGGEHSDQQRDFHTIGWTYSNEDSEYCDQQSVLHSISWNCSDGQSVVREVGWGK